MNLFTYIKEHNSIVTVAQEYVTIKKAGIYYKGPCPFHQEKDASFTISPHKEIFYCFGCHATGDVISFIAQIEGCNQLEAAKLLIDKYGIDVPPELLHEHKTSFVSADEKNRYFSLCNLVAQWCAQQLKTSSNAQPYVTARNIKSSVIKTFTMGFFPSGLRALKNLQQYIQKQGFLVKDLIDAHIIIEGKHGIYSPYEDRIIFPISDHLGRFCGFGGRIFKKGDERAKYYNSRENLHFNKGTILFGLHQAKKAIQKKEYAFLVEGYTDCLAMVQHGYTNTIATLGTACSHEHLKQLSHYADYLYVLFDGDRAGLQAMLRLTQLCWNANIDIRVIVLPQGEDPASFLGAENTLDQHIQQAQDVFSFFIKNSGIQYKNQSLKKRLLIVQEIIKIITSINDPLKQTLLLQDAAYNLNLPFETLKKECLRTQYKTHNKNEHKQALSNQLSPKQDHPEQDNPEQTRSEKVLRNIDIPAGEKKIVALILQYPEIIDREEYPIIVNTLSEPLRAILHHLKKLVPRSLNKLLETLNENEKALTHNILISHDNIQKGDLDREINQFIKYRWKIITQIAKEQIKQAQQVNNTKQVIQLLSQLQQLKNKLFKLEL